MSEPINDGGAAFARPPAWSPGYQPEVTASQRGMTLRDYFAAKALEGMCANPGIIHGEHRLPEHPEDCRWEIAESAFKIANAMLKAREAIAP